MNVLAGSRTIPSRGSSAPASSALLVLRWTFEIAPPVKFREAQELFGVGCVESGEQVDEEEL